MQPSQSASAVSIARKNPGMNVILTLVAALLAFACWSSAHRTARVDDELEANSTGGALSWPDMRIDINRAGAAELALLPGVGDRLADRIIQNRDVHGPFRSLDDLERVPGMGAATIERLTPYALASTP